MNKFNFFIDRGGTFTDCICITANQSVKTMKLLSEDPENYKDAPTEIIKRLLIEELGKDKVINENGLINTSHIGCVRMGTTVATNALLERKGEKIVLVVNKGLKDILQIGNQARPKIFDLNIRKPSNLYEKVIEVDCRIVPERNDCELGEISSSWRKVSGISNSTFLVQKELNVDEVRGQLQNVFDLGITSVAVCLAHSYACPEQELIIGDIAKSVGFTTITLSHQAMPMIRLVNRSFTSCAEAYLEPHVHRYLKSFKAGFEKNLEGVEVLFMQSDGGLTNINRFRGAKAILSGPAGGVIGYSLTGSRDTNLPLIGFDMGGTSTDVSRFDGNYEHVIESTTAGVTIQAPQLDINTVAAGGGSQLFFRSGMYVVGPESAGAHPGPACYKKGGPLTITDANLVLGRLLPEYFPKIFGPHEDEPLDVEIAMNKFSEITKLINDYNKTEELSIQDVAMGFIRVANESMCRPIRALTQSRGFDTSKHALAVFGGAGGQHACSIAKELGMKTVLIHKYAGILSAYGMAYADVVYESQEPYGFAFETKNIEAIKNLLDKLSSQCITQLKNQGFSEENIQCEPYLHLRYNSTDCALMISPDKVSKHELSVPNYGDFISAFLTRYQKEFGFILENRSIIVDDVRVRGLGKTKIPDEPLVEKAKSKKPNPEKMIKVFFDNKWMETKLFIREKLMANHEILGPAIIIDRLSTIVIEPNSSAFITERGDIIITIGENSLQKVVGVELDPIQLSIFSHRFMSIAEQCGRVLQRTSISTNIKERLDFSCALFAQDGGLVSNAPHIPVHLGAMQETVRYQIKTIGNTLKDGDVILSNHPHAGGSHLPDLTVITPVFYASKKEPVFFVASRGHHADIGGITSGSMPPHSKSLSEEGAAFKSFLLVDGGVFNEKGITDALISAGTRNLSDNISDLKAQIAANHKGIILVRELIDIYGIDVVQAFMKYIQENAAECVRDMLKEIALDTKKRTGASVLKATEFMDDGTPISLEISIDEQNGTAVFDFSETGYEVYGNCNTPRAIVMSAIIYCLRCMVGYDIPLNQGCLNPIEVIIPENCILNPSKNAAVVGGNVLTSQRIVDVILKAFKVCAASCGCMNNVTFGDDKFGYYETVGGGSGAGPNWHGTSGLHTHMTNTRITDLEILEQRYPIILKTFCLRDDNSGGNGLFKGGEGVKRELLFRKPVKLSVLTERRVVQNYGMEGGKPGKVGLNLLKRNDGLILNLGSKTAIDVIAGDIFSMLTPGGGGYGKKVEKRRRSYDNNNEEEEERAKTFYEKGSLFAYRMLQESV
ncbi:hypothetical protein PVAND_005619 [Polypedilum vanderplanki]|uniref:5-oxoprolinase n=1 Tax=Polypedilum vanderplanki TaxID=319348 RepID=A0A9J6C1K5_POLVA|nr:hypothetical protein PVAND_005619 [Polypedilum vanderplanki]